MRRSVKLGMTGAAAVAALLLGPVVAVPSASAAQAVPAASVSAQTVMPAPVAAAKKKKTKAKPSAAKFAKKVNAYAKKKVRAAKVTSAVEWPLPVKTSKKRDWWVQPGSGKGYKLGNKAIGMSSSQATVTRYRKAVAAAFARDGMKPTGTVKDPGGVVTKAYANSRYACTVKYETANPRYSSGASFWCTTKSKANAAVKKSAPFRDAYRKTSRTKGLVFNPPTIEASSAPSYRKYRKASAGIWPVTGAGGFNGKFAKAPGKKWRFVIGLQWMGDCADWEKTSVASRAFAGDPCWRDDHEDTITAW